MSKSSAQILEEANAKATAEVTIAIRDNAILTGKDAGMTGAAATAFYNANRKQIEMDNAGRLIWNAGDGDPISLFDHLRLNVAKTEPFYFALPKEVANQRATENDALIRAALYSPKARGELVKKIGADKVAEAMTIEGLNMGQFLVPGVQPPSGRKYNGDPTEASLGRVVGNGSADTGGIDKRSKANPWSEENIDPKLGRYSDASMAKRASIIKNLGMKVATELAAAAGKQVQDMR